MFDKIKNDENFYFLFENFLVLSDKSGKNYFNFDRELLITHECFHGPDS